MSGLDLNRGVIKRFHPHGMQICMYMDTPGVYCDEDGRPVSDELATGSGYDVAKLAQDRERGRLEGEFKRQLDTQFNQIADKLAQLSADGPEGVEIRELGNNLFAIYRDDERFTPFDLTISEAESLLSSILPEVGNDGNETNDEDSTAGSGKAIGGSAEPSKGKAQQDAGQGLI